MSRARTIIETLASLIPGYRGYSDRESRRDSDRALRHSIANTLDATRGTIDESIAACSRAMEFDRIEQLERLRRRVATVTDAIRHAPSGYAGLLDTAAVGAPEIDALHQYDAALHEHTQRLATEIRAVATGGGDAAALDALLAELEEDVRRRDEILKGGR